ncbi:MAG: sigma-70 family RNA polymerase sigma factor [Flavobacteriales bacterium]
MRITRKHIKSLSDENIVLLYKQSNDQKCIGELYVRYSTLVMGVSLKYLKNVADAQDNLMQVFEKLMAELKKSEVRNFKPWLYQITKNQCLMRLRKNKKIHKTALDTQPLVQEEDTTDFHQKKEILLTKLEEFIPNLKENQRVCIELFYLQNKSYVQIAEQTNLSLKEVKSNIQNGKRNLEIKLKE